MTCWGGAAAEVRFGGCRISKVVDFRVGIAHSVLEDSPIGQLFTSAKLGKISTTAGGTMLYRSGDPDLDALIRSVLSWGRRRGKPVTLRLNRIGTCIDLPTVLVRQLDIDVAVGQLTKIPVQFQVNCLPVPVLR